jgi:hypothetical protein
MILKVFIEIFLYLIIENEIAKLIKKTAEKPILSHQVIPFSEVNFPDLEMILFQEYSPTF